MEVFKIKFTVIILFYLTAIAISKELEIYRTRLPGEDGWRVGRDSFKIPPSLCNQGIKCTKFSALTESQCFCMCPHVDATFLLDNNDWSCAKNQRVRRLLGYDSSNYTGFDAERLNNPLRMIDVNDRKRISLSPGFLNCQVEVGSSWYIGCSGSTSFSTLFNNNTPLFTIVPDGDPADSPPYFLKVNSGVTNSTLLAGRVINLGIVCSSSVRRRLLFKFVGNLKCVAPTLPPAETTKPSDRTVKSLSSKGTGIAGNTVTDLKITHSTIPTGFHTPTTVSEVRPTDTDARATVRQLPSNFSPAPTRPGRERSIDDSISWGLVAGLTASIIIAVIIVGFIIYRHFYPKKFKKPKLPAKGITRGNTNEASPQSHVAQVPDVENGYRVLNVRHPINTIYTSNYKVPPCENARPVYASLNFQGGRNTASHSDTPVSAEYVDPDYDSALRAKNKRPISLEQVVYNQMEELSIPKPTGPMGTRSVQDGDEIGTQQENNVLEPYLQCSKRPSHYGAIPNGTMASVMFTTLEKPYPKNANELEAVPEYHVLEKDPYPSVHTR